MADHPEIICLDSSDDDTPSWRDQHSPTPGSTTPSSHGRSRSASPPPSDPEFSDDDDSSEPKPSIKGYLIVKDDDILRKQNTNANVEPHSDSLDGDLGLDHGEGLDTMSRHKEDLGQRETLYLPYPDALLIL
jgi:hypothetical protein